MPLAPVYPNRLQLQSAFKDARKDINSLAATPSHHSHCHNSHKYQLLRTFHPSSLSYPAIILLMARQLSKNTLGTQLLVSHRVSQYTVGHSEPMPVFFRQCGVESQGFRGIKVSCVFNASPSHRLTITQTTKWWANHQQQGLFKPPLHGMMTKSPASLPTYTNPGHCLNHKYGSLYLPGDNQVICFAAHPITASDSALPISLSA